jgi:uncharacterized protein
MKYKIVRGNIPCSSQQVDAPRDQAMLNRVFEHMQSDELLLLWTDYPHWQFEGNGMLTEGLSSKFVRKMTNSLATYGRLNQR